MPRAPTLRYYEEDPNVLGRKPHQRAPLGSIVLDSAKVRRNDDAVWKQLASEQSNPKGR